MLTEGHRWAACALALTAVVVGLAVTHAGDAAAAERSRSLRMSVTEPAEVMAGRAVRGRFAAGQGESGTIIRRDRTLVARFSASTSLCLGLRGNRFSVLGGTGRFAGSRGSGAHRLTRRGDDRRRSLSGRLLPGRRALPAACEELIAVRRSTGAPRPAPSLPSPPQAVPATPAPGPAPAAPAAPVRPAAQPEPEPPALPVDEPVTPPLDTTAPGVTLTAPADGSAFADPAPVFAGTAGVGPGDVRTVTITIATAAGTPAMTLTTAVGSDGAWSARATEPLSAGTYTARAEQSDAAGNAGQSTTVTFTVDPSAPAVTLTGPAADTRDPTPGFAGTASEPAAVRVRVRAASGEVVQALSTTPGAGGAFSVDAAALGDGAYTAQAEQTDAVGNTGQSGALSFRVDTTVPQVTLTGPGATDDATPAFSGSASEARPVRVEIVASGGERVQTLTATPRPGGAYAIDATALDDGTYTARAEQTDAAGNPGHSDPETFTIDTSAPTVSLTAPGTTNDATPAFTGTASEATVVRVRISAPRAGDVQTLEATPGAGGAFSAEATTLADGTYTVRAEQTDAAGNPGASETRTLTVDTAAPALTLTTPGDGSQTADASPTVAGSGGIAPGDADAVEVRITRGDGLVRTLAATREPGGAFAVTPPRNLALGPYTVRAEQADAAGNTGATASRTFTVVAPETPVIAASGDIACDPSDSAFNAGLGTPTRCRQGATSDLVTDESLSAVLILGDVQYADGTPEKFARSYDPSWGRVKDVTRPAIGNHEYWSAGATGYFDYFNGAGNPTGPAGDRSTGYYSYDIGAWHFVALNSNCSIVACAAGSAQEQWLRADLAANASACTLAYFHHPRWSSSKYGSSTAVAPLVQALYDDGADVMLTGHAHLYERFAPQAPDGTADPADGIRQFVVGTGGKSLYDFGSTAPNSGMRQNWAYGVLNMTLRPNGYDWSFVAAPGAPFTDVGTDVCEGAYEDQAPPTEPGAPAATIGTEPSVALRWEPSTDDDGVAGYRIFRDGTQIGTSRTPSYPDTTVPPDATVGYAISAYDPAGKDSPRSAATQVTTPPSTSTTFEVAEDAYVQLDSPSTTFDGERFVADNEPVRRSLLRVAVAGVGTKPVVSAKLRIHCVGSSPAGGTVRRVADSTWSEDTVTWDDAPAADTTVLGTLGEVQSATWYEVDVTAAVTGDGTYSFAMDSTSTNGAYYAAREAGPATAARLVVTTE